MTINANRVCCQTVGPMKYTKEAKYVTIVIIVVMVMEIRILIIINTRS